MSLTCRAADDFSKHTETFLKLQFGTYKLGRLKSSQSLPEESSYHYLFGTAAQRCQILFTKSGGKHPAQRGFSPNISPCIIYQRTQ